MKKFFALFLSILFLASCEDNRVLYTMCPCKVVAVAETNGEYVKYKVGVQGTYVTNKDVPHGFIFYTDSLYKVGDIIKIQ